MSSYYSTTTLLAIAINRHVYRGKHFVYFADGFYPYGDGNPKSSNPLLIYMDLYQPWKDKDGFDKYIAQHRISLVKGVLAKKHDGLIKYNIPSDLCKIANSAKLELFCPVVYRAQFDMQSAINNNRAKIDGSGKKGSKEYLIPDLTEGEYDLLFDDNEDYRLSRLKNPVNEFQTTVDAIAELLKWTP